MTMATLQKIANLRVIPKNPHDLSLIEQFARGGCNDHDLQG